MKKLTLDFEEPAEWQTIGISSQLADYKLVFRINKILKTSFVRTDSFIVETAKFKGEFSLYFFNDESNRVLLFLLSNKNNNRVLVPEFRQFDYLLIIEGDAGMDYLKEITRKIREINQVLFTQPVDVNNIKNYSALSEAFELHLDKAGIVRE